MNSLFFIKLAFTNLRKNKSTYLPFILSCVFSIIIYYSLHAISINQGLAQMPGANNLKALFAMGIGIMSLFCIVLLFYTNSFLIKRRKKEIGLYNILGLEKRRIAIVLFIETLLVALCSLIIGMFGGILISKLLFLVLLNILNFPTTLAFSVSIPSVMITIKLFATIFVIILIYNLLQIRLNNPINLLKSTQHGEKEPKTRGLLTVVGLLSLGAGYIIAVKVQTPIDALVLFFLAVFLVIIGTYCLFTAGSVAILKALKKNKSYYYQPQHFISLSGMIYRMKQNAVGLASICILSTMVLVTLSTTLCLYLGQKDVMHQQFAHEVIIRCADEDTRTQALELSQQLSKESDVTLKNPMQYRNISVYAAQGPNGFTTDESQIQGQQMPNTFNFIPLDGYNKIANSNYTLDQNQVLVFCDLQTDPVDATLQLNDMSYDVKEELATSVLADKNKSAMVTSYYVIMADMDAIQSLCQQVNQPHVDSTHATTKTNSYHLVYDLEGDDNAKLSFATMLTQSLNQTVPKNFVFDSMHISQQNWLITNGGFLFLGIFLGVLFLMANILIIYYKQISEGYDDHDRFKIMQKVGLSKKEVKKTISKQILTVFFLPLAVAIVHVAVAFGIIRNLLMVFGMANYMLFFLCTVSVILAFAIVYALVYALTARSYYKIVQQG